MFISLKAMDFNSLLHFLETSSYACFSFQPCFFSFPCICFVQSFNTFLSGSWVCVFLSSLRNILSFPTLHNLRTAFPHIKVWFPSCFPPKHNSSYLYCSLTSFNSHTLTWLLLVPSMLLLTQRNHQRSLFLLNQVYIYIFPSHGSWNLFTFSSLLLPFNTFVPTKCRVVVGGCPSYCTW